MEREIDIERARWARLDRQLGLTGDPLRVFDPCMACGQRGPRVPVWMRPPMTAALALKLPREEQIRLASTYVCADGCPAPGDGGHDGGEEDRDEEEGAAVPCR